MRPLALCLLACLALGCRSRSSGENLSYTFFKKDISQIKLLQDEDELRRSPGVVHVISTQRQDGSGQLEVEVTDQYHLTVQQKLSDMGYSKGLH